MTTPKVTLSLLMRNIFYTILFHSLFINFCWAQDNPEDKVKRQLFRPFVILGMNAAQVDGDDLAGYTKLGANAGLGTFIMLPKKFSVGFELLYSQKGAIVTKNNRSPLFDFYKLNLDYLDIPIMVSFHDKDRAIFGLGIVVNNLVRSREERGIPGTIPDFEFKRLGLEGIANVSFHFSKKWGINLRFAYSLTDIASQKYVTANNLPVSNLRDASMRNNYFTARLFYLIK